MKRFANSETFHRFIDNKEVEEGVFQVSLFPPVNALLGLVLPQLLLTCQIENQ